MTNPRHNTKLKSSHTPGYWLAVVETQCAHRVSLHVGHNGDTGGHQGTQGGNRGTPGRFEADGEDRLFTVKLDTSKWHIMVVAR